MIIHFIFAAALSVLAPIHAFEQHFNAGDTAFPSDAFTDRCTVLDEFAPFVWDGGTDVGDIHTWWYRLVGSNDPKRRVRFLSYKQHVAFSAPSQVSVKGNRAYVSMPATLTYVEKGA